MAGDAREMATVMEELVKRLGGVAQHDAVLEHYETGGDDRECRERPSPDGNVYLWECRDDDRESLSVHLASLPDRGPRHRREGDL